MRCAIHQPNFLPRLSTLAKIYRADVWIVLNDVQFARRDYQHRARLARLDEPTHQQWLTLPVRLPHGRATLINDVRLAEPDASRLRVAALLQQYYGKSPHWRRLRPALDEITDLLARTSRLAEVSEASTHVLLRSLGWTGQTVHSATLAARPSRSQRLADLCKAIGGGIYLCGEGGMRYLDHSPFRAEGITVVPVGTPSAEASPIWTHAKRITGLWAFMAIGPDAVGSTLLNSI